MKIVIALLVGLSLAGLTSHFVQGVAFTLGSVVVTWVMCSFVAGMALGYKATK